MSMMEYFKLKDKIIENQRLARWSSFLSFCLTMTLFRRMV